MNDYYFNSKCYDHKGRRIAVFGRETLSNKLEIVEITCSKLDQFSKQYAHSAYHLYKTSKAKLNFHPKVHYKEIREGDSIKWTFEQYCKNSFYHLVDCEITITDKRINMGATFKKLPNTKPQVIKIKTL